MESAELEKESIEATRTINDLIDNRGVRQNWFCDKLGMTVNTLKVRLNNPDSWKESELLALKQLSILK